MNAKMSSSQNLSGLPWWFSSKETTSKAEAVGNACIIHGWEICPGGEHGNTLPFLPGESHGQRSLVGYNPKVPRVRHGWSNLTCTHSRIK